MFGVSFRVVDTALLTGGFSFFFSYSRFSKYMGGILSCSRYHFYLTCH